VELKKIEWEKIIKNIKIYFLNRKKFNKNVIFEQLMDPIFLYNNDFVEHFRAFLLTR